MPPASTADLDLRVQALTEGLRARQAALEQAIREAEREEARTSEALARLYTRACASVDDAVSLLTFLLESGGTDEHLMAAESLVEICQAARRRLESGMTPTPGRPT